MTPEQMQQMTSMMSSMDPAMMQQAMAQMKNMNDGDYDAMRRQVRPGGDLHVRARPVLADCSG